MNNKPTLAFATMCKDEEHCIRECLESVKPYVDYILVHDTGSTDNTIKIVNEFLEETGIPGEVFESEWVAFDVNKTLMMERVKDKTDYVLHFDADDFLRGDFSFNFEDAGMDQYLMTMRRTGTNYIATLLYNNRITWKFCGVAHTIIRCLDKSPISTGTLTDRGYIESEPIGSRILDPDKYKRDAEKLEKQFFRCLIDDPDGLLVRSCFYAAQSWLDHGNLEKALQWKKLYLNLTGTWSEERFEANLRIGRILIQLEKPFEEIKKYFDAAIELQPDRAEPYFGFGRYLNAIKKNELAYQYLKKGKECSLEKAKQKYILFVQQFQYEKYINDDLSVACYWTGRFEEGMRYLNEIYEDPDFAHMRERLDENKKHFENMLSQTQTIEVPKEEFVNNDITKVLDIFATTISK